MRADKTKEQNDQEAEKEERRKTSKLDSSGIEAVERD